MTSTAASAGIGPDGPRTHPRSIGWVGTTALAMGGSNQSLFIIGAVLASQGTAAIPLLAVGLLLSWLALPGWTELIMMWPNRVGGIAASCAEAFRPYSPVLANLTGFCYWWGWVPTCGLTAILSASALHEWYLPGVPVKAMAIAIVLLFAAANFAGIRWVTRIAVPVATLSALLALLSAVVPVVAGKVDWSRALSFHLSAPFPGAFGGLTSAMAGLYLIGFAAPAFEAAACHVGETVNPEVNVPRAMYASAAMASLYFVVLPVVWLGALGSGPLEGTLTSALGPTFAPLLGGSAAVAAIWFMVFNMFHGTLQPLAGAARTLMQLAEDGLLPRVLGLRTRRTDVPWVATALTAAMSIVFLLLGDPTWLIAAANLTYLIGICLPSLAVWLLRRHAPEAARPYRAPRGWIQLGLVAAAAWGAATILGFEQFGLPTVIAGLGLAYAGSALYAMRRWSDRRAAGTRAVARSLHTKLTGAMLLVLVLDGAGYLLAVEHIEKGDPALVTGLQDIFVGVALLTISVGLVLPGLIGHAVGQVASAADRVVAEPLSALIASIHALGAGDLAKPLPHVDAEPVQVRSRDEIGAMAQSFNRMQHEIVRAVDSLGDAREGLRTATEGFTRLSRQNELLLTSTGESIVGLDRDGNIAFLNPAAAQLLGYAADELIGRDFHATVHHHRADGTSFPADECSVVQTLRGRKLASVSDDDLVWHRDGSQIPVRSSASPIVEDGAIAGLVLVLSDMSAQRQLEAEMRQAQKMEAVGQLAGGIAHDFNNLLTAIGGYASFAIDRVGESNSALQADLEEIQRAAERAGGLTQQLLAFSRRQLRQVSIVDLNAVVEDTGTLLDRLIGEEIEIERNLDPELGRTKADVGQLGQVLINLAVNARDAMPKGGTLTIETANVTLDEAYAADHPGAVPGPYVMLAVHDNGVGMDELAKVRMFEPFFTTKGPGKGTGLGLSTVYGIVKQSDGYLTAESVLGEGTVFRVYLRRTFEKVEVVRPRPAPACEPGRQERILLVEDEAVVRALVSEMLEQNGYAVRAAADPLEALEICETDWFDLLLTDIVMPKMRGPELAARLAERCPELRVLYTSGYPHDVLGDILTSGTAFLAKPFTIGELTQKVRSVLEAGALEDAAVAAAS